MTSEVCPFCGKTYKRLKSHLPHCKAAPPTTQDVTAAQESSSHPAAVLSKTTAKAKKAKQMSSVATDLLPERSKKVSAVSLKPVQLAAPANGSSSSSSFASTLPSSKKTKQTQTLVDQIRTTALSTSPSSPLSSSLSKPKKSLRSSIEAAKSENIAKETLKGTRSASKDSSRTSDRTKIKAVADSFKVTSVFSVPAETKANEESKMKVPKMKDVFPTTKYTSDFLDSNVNKNNTSLRRVRENFWVDGEEETKESSVNGLFSKPGNGNQMKVTLQDVKATLGRANSRRQSGRPSILCRITAADNLSSDITLDTDISRAPLGDQKHATNYLATPTNESDKQLSTAKQPRALQLFQEKSKPPSLIPPQDADHQLEPASECADVQQRRSSSLCLNERLKATPYRGLLSVLAPFNQFSSHLLPPAAAQCLPGMVEDLQHDFRKKHGAEKRTEGLLTQRNLGQVRLRELPDWLASRTPGRPRDAVEMVQRGWLWYYRRYIDVKKGGVGGLSMLLAGYCVLSYIWSYPHIKLSRWRKYH
ncbi:hypothetical protein ATANTOWER_010700 [Ataeniobius toweri]|uniref:ATP synthase subunit f, mitochondrial n=1 Tax=Ataeniobius toweri TaxID=208326 RepID=A0ABU7BDH9_9TELE|nr:hypothetical protein [Ataeniobius toweri]